MDLEDWNATRTVVDAIGHIDLLVNNAGVNVLESFLDIQQDSFDKYVYIDLIFFLVCWQYIYSSIINLIWLYFL